MHRLFPERQIVIRTEGRVSFLTLSKRFQVSTLAVFLAFGGWAAFASVTYVLNDRVIADKDEQIASVRLAYRSLLTQVEGYNRKFTALSRNLDENHSMMLGLVEQNASLQQNLKTVVSQLKDTEQDRETVLATREDLRGQLSNTENDLRSMSNSNKALKENLQSIESDLQGALSERNEALFEGTRMRRQLKELEIRLVELEETEKDAILQLTDRTVNFNETMERVIEIAGLDPKKVLAANGSLQGEGQGGPFVPAKPDDNIAASKLKASLSELDRHLLYSEGLQDVMRKLPLAPPLTYYRITSTYGKRRDPMNNKWSAHYGLDMGSPYKSQVFATASGVVTFAGWKGKFGKMVEIDHGAGLITRFAHLNSILVKKGQKIQFRDKVGLLGSTGRSTGAHLHYEISFRGRYMNPLYFFKAGRNVFQE